MNLLAPAAVGRRPVPGGTAGSTRGADGACPRRRVVTALAAACIGLGLGSARGPQAAGVPPSPPSTPDPTVDEIWNDATRRRALPVRVRWPASGSVPPPGGWPAVLFSHGLGGTRAGGEGWGRAWSAAGLVVLHLQHPGSDFAAVRSSGPADFIDREALRRAAGPRQLLARLQDMGFALDELARRHALGNDRWQMG